MKSKRRSRYLKHLRRIWVSYCWRAEDLNSIEINAKKIKARILRWIR